MKSFGLMMEALFWSSFCLVAYTYFVYPAILFVAYSLAQLRSDWLHLFGRKDRRVRPLSEGEVPNITLVVPAYNEGAHLHQKLTNFGEMDYPKEKMQIIFVSDGSTDSTNEILKDSIGPNMEMIVLPERSGKATALNHAVARAEHDILVFSDASTLFAPDTLRKLVRHFVDPRVGAVCGALQFHSSAESQQTEGIYWKYESMIRLMEARLGLTLTASGAVYALRRNAYLSLDRSAVLDDFIIPMNARRAGYSVKYDPEATATDYGAETVEGEFVRRVRLATGSFQSLMFFLGVKLGLWGRFAFVSHKLLRWIVPLLLFIVLVSNVFLVRNPVYTVLACLQVAFYVWAGLGFYFRKRLGTVRFALLPYYLLAMNLAFLLGLFRSFVSHQSVVWQRVE